MTDDVTEKDMAALIHWYIAATITNIGHNKLQFYFEEL